MTILVVALVSILLCILFYFWWTGRNAIHYRGVTWQEFQDFTVNLLRDAVGSKLIVQDESSGEVVIVEKTAMLPNEMTFSLRSRPSQPEPESRIVELESRIRVTGEGRRASAEAEAGWVQVAVQSSRATALGDVNRALYLLLEWLGSSPVARFHLYFDARPDPEALRHRYEADLVDPSVSETRRRVAELGLRALIKRTKGRPTERKSPN